MKLTLKKELPLITIVLLPIIYLTFIWNSLPAKVPMHWKIKGEINRFGDKHELLFVSLLLPLVIYLIFLFIPIIDPKNKISKMGNKYHHIKFLLTSFMSILALFIIYSAKTQSFANSNYIVLLIGILYIMLGNYFKTIKANYFIGIRTPWTLENETVWRETHKLGGKMWFIGGLLVVLSSLILDKALNFTCFIIITGVISIVPVAYSYFKFKKIEQTI